MAILGTFAALSDPGRAEPTIAPIEVVSVPPTGVARSPLNTAPKISDDGSIVVFDSTRPATAPATDPVPVVMVRDRAGATTVAVDDAPSLHPGVSGDGCVIAYSVPDPVSDEVDLVVAERSGPDPCTAGAAGPSGLASHVVHTVAASAATDGALPAPALSADGSVVVWSTGTAVLRFVDDGSGYTLTDTIDPPLSIPAPVGAAPARVVGPAVDVSADGAAIVFAAGAGPVPYAPTSSSNVFLWAVPAPPSTPTPPATVELVSVSTTTSLSNGFSSAPSISGDGRIVTFQSDSANLAVGVGSLTPAPYVVMIDRLGADRVLANSASKPMVSTDGSTIVYDTTADIRRVHSTGSAPFTSVTNASLSTGINGTAATGPSVSGPVVSGNGTIGVFDSTLGAQLVADPAVATGTHVFARTVDDTVTTSTPPPTVAPTTPTTAPPVTAPPTTVPASTVGPPATTVPASTVPNRPVPPTTSPPYRPPATSGSGSSGSSGRPVGSSSTVTYATPTSTLAVAFVPVAVEFSPTIAGAGRQTTDFSISNPTPQSVQVIDVAIQNDPAGAFAVVDDACSSAPIPGGGSCQVTVAFAPIALGSSPASIVATLSNGQTASAMVGGTGAPPPVLTIVPGVASNGQVVAVQGSGFPAGLTVSLTWLGNEPALTIQVDASGSFVETMIVLPRTPRGPGSAVVEGQADQFATVTGDVLITDTSDRSSSVLTQSAGSPFAS